MTEQPLVVEALGNREVAALSRDHEAAREAATFLVGGPRPLVARLLEALAALPTQTIDDLAEALVAASGQRVRTQELVDAVGRVSTQGERDRDTQSAWNAAIRTEFLKGVETLTARELAERAHSRSGNPSALAWRWRNTGLVMGVPVRGEWRYPAFQFDRESGRPLPIIHEIVQVIGARLGPWGTALWFTGPNGWLEGDRPADRLGDEEALLAAAHAAVERPEF